ncbi:MAG TPA: hypothetical protein DIT04_10850 [Dysgonomonas sp.]|nr:hypothetical protein [Dysgonomonas sp.]
MDNHGAFIVIAIIAIPFIFTLIVVWTKSLERRKNNELMAELYKKSLEHGQPAPSLDLFQPKNKNNSLRTGILLIFIGIGISTFMVIVSSGENILHGIATGLVPFFLGIGFLVIHFIWKKKNYTDEE